MSDPYTVSQHPVDPAMYEVFTKWRQQPNKVFRRLVCVIHEDDLPAEVVERCKEDGSIEIWFTLGEE